jgi:hypothetical protein
MLIGKSQIMIVLHFRLFKEIDTIPILSKMECIMTQIICIIVTFTKIVTFISVMGSTAILPNDEQILTITKFVAYLSNIVLYHPNFGQE